MLKFLSLALLISFCWIGCGNTNPTPTSTPTPTATPTDASTTASAVNWTEVTVKVDGMT